ncbi:PIN domain-containing protein [Paracraurococcus lichenis]|uniref:Ribonuclease VapC n=1 Tax=Paracraurococcus lichenis TaxID=3064888 RepID=A0ABT9E2D6_9PROT|nr:PIN domain-containing protein [Paracraurococcus sp. LOR1-02]MDO9710311.1 PIN domain-containing protein [Paracraurococcus sp. LOR1-02]
MAEPRLLLDASALLALVFEERGAERVLASLDGAAISAVNLAEVVEVAARRGLDPARAAAWAEELSLPVLGFAAPMAARAGALLAAFRHQGLSLGDAACLGTAAVLGLPAVTADRLWSEIAAGVEVRLIR